MGIVRRDERLTPEQLWRNTPDEPKITFEVQDVEYLDHNDALVVSVRIANAQEVMVNTASSNNVLYFNAF
ncbi:hypothetical protein BHE74_00012592 [Ensete ventricosum]|nr:hypothetical protein GW17_00048409 [Ensete ventricosum]RWW79138.1 hypothetical protein BHE74_00012592 [Ensete ventricosum]RZR83558.1 hypothetical protein BHM03_00010217 [Ensete ventricosum]